MSSYKNMDSAAKQNSQNDEPKSNQNYNWKKIAIIVVIAGAILGVIIGVALHFKAKSDSNENIKALTNLDFNIPSYCKVADPTFSGVTDSNYFNNWTANNNKTNPELGYSTVVVLYPNLKEKKLQTAMHIKGNGSEASGKIELPGGPVDFEHESLKQGALRMLKQQSMAVTFFVNDVSITKLHLIHGKIQKDEKKETIFGLYVLFVNDTKAVNGPGEKLKKKIQVNKDQGFVEPSRHKFVSWTLPADGAKTTPQLDDIKSANELTSSDTTLALELVSKSVYCDFSGKGGVSTTTSQPVPQTTQIPTSKTIQTTGAPTKAQSQTATSAMPTNVRVQTTTKTPVAPSIRSVLQTTEEPEGLNLDWSA